MAPRLAIDRSPVQVRAPLRRTAHPPPSCLHSNHIIYQILFFIDKNNCNHHHHPLVITHSLRASQPGQHLLHEHRFHESGNEDALGQVACLSRHGVLFLTLDAFAARERRGQELARVQLVIFEHVGHQSRDILDQRVHEPAPTHANTQTQAGQDHKSDRSPVSSVQTTWQTKHAYPPTYWSCDMAPLSAVVDVASPKVVSAVWAHAALGRNASGSTASSALNPPATPKLVSRLSSAAASAPSVLPRTSNKSNSSCNCSNMSKSPHAAKSIASCASGATCGAPPDTHKHTHKHVHANCVSSHCGDAHTRYELLPKYNNNNYYYCCCCYTHTHTHTHTHTPKLFGNNSNQCTVVLNHDHAGWIALWLH